MKIKILLFLTVFLLPLVKGQSQDTTTCLHSELIEKMKQEDPRLGNIGQQISYGAKRFRELHPDLQFYPNPQPPPPCDICMTSYDATRGKPLFFNKNLLF